MSDEIPQVTIDSELLETSPVQQLDPKKQRFVHLYISGQYTIKDLAQVMNVGEPTIRNWLKNPTIKQIITDVQTDEDEIVKQGIKALRLKAMHRMNQLIDSKMDAIALQAAKDVLDRTGHKAPTKQEVQVEIYTFEQQIKELVDKSKAYDVSYEVVE